MQEMLQFVREYGAWVYLGLFVLCALKSGAFPLFAGVAAHAGALEPTLVAAASFAGGYLGDEARFALARRYGDRFIMSRPRLREAFERARTLFHRYGAAYVFLYRYPKGLRTIGAFPVGMTDMPWARFTALNAASAVVWTGLLVGAGYAFGGAIVAAVESGWGVASLALLMSLSFIGVWLWQRSITDDTTRV